MSQFVIIVATFGLFWVLFIRPQQQRLRAHRAFVGALAVGDRVITTSGFYGVIRALEDESVSLELAPGVVVRIARGAVSRSVSDSEPHE